MNYRLKSAIEAVPVAESLHGAHPLVSKMRQAMLAAKPEPSGIVEVPWTLRVLYVNVSRAQTSRALRIMDALVKAVERRGAIFVKSKNSDCQSMHLSIGGENVGIYLTEKVNKTERPLKKGADPLAWRWKWEKWDCQPTGNLQFRILECVPSDARRCWTDCTRYKLESKLGEIVEWLFVTGAAIKQTRLAREEMWRKREEERQRQEQERLRQEALHKKAERLRQMEEENRDSLEAAAQNWREAKLLRRFIRVCEGELEKDRKPTATDSWHDRWLIWAREHADRLDPMTNGYLYAEGHRLTAPDVEAEIPKPEKQFGKNVPF